MFPFRAGGENAKMKYDKTKWTEAITKAVEDLKTESYTAGRVCAVAAVRYIRDGLIDDLYGIKPGEPGGKDDADNILAIRESFGELIKQISTKSGTECGFASNASAAAKAAGYKTSETDSTSALEG